jgi:ubiquinone/menaquinone biosynthesis C-methylase UbiE
MTNYERWFVRMPWFAGVAYDWLAQRPRSMAMHFRELARELAPKARGGRLLDVGTGPGRLLREIHEVDPAIELHGLDLAAAMVRRARHNLADLRVDLRQGSIARTDYESDFFNVITCTGSFYLWDDQAAGVREIHRILAPGGSAHLIEPDAQTPVEVQRRTIPSVLRRETPLRRLLGPLFIRKALRMGLRQNEVKALLAAGPFAQGAAITKVSLAGLPIWLHLALTKRPG